MAVRHGFEPQSALFCHSEQPNLLGQVETGMTKGSLIDFIGLINLVIGKPRSGEEPA